MTTETAPVTWILLTEAIERRLAPSRTVAGLQRMIRRHNAKLPQGHPSRIRQRMAHVVEQDLAIFARR